jgi:hypothetical protein
VLNVDASFFSVNLAIKLINQSLNKAVATFGVFQRTIHTTLDDKARQTLEKTDISLYMLEQLQLIKLE